MRAPVIGQKVSGVLGQKEMFGTDGCDHQLTVGPSRSAVALFVPTGYP